MCEFFIVIILQSILVLLNHSKFKILTFKWRRNNEMFNETKSKPIQHENCVGWAWKCWLKNLLAIKFSSKTIFLQSTWFIPFLLFLLSGIPIQQLIQHGIFVMLDEMLDRFNKALRPYSHLTLCLTLNFIFGYCSKACSDLKITVNIFYWYMLVTWPWRHGWRIFADKTH